MHIALPSKSNGIFTTLILKANTLIFVVMVSIFAFLFPEAPARKKMRIRKSIAL